MTRDDPASFAPPPAFGPFRVLHQIGIGALGPVFRTYEPSRDRLVAVKVFRLDITPEQAQVLADELARAADAGLFHPSVVEPIAAGVQGTVAYRAEEYVAAESLDAAIRHYAPASLDKAMPFLTQLAGAIDFARTAGVGHGALHLRDIFVTPDEARASGFGVVEALERVGLRAPVRRPYSAPERIAGDQWSTPADVFSLAAIAYELLTGRRPSGTGDQIGPLAGEHLAPHAAAMRGVLARAMDDEPARRYPTALAFASALDAAARGGRVTDVVMTAGATSGGGAPAAAAQPAPPAIGLAGAGDAAHEVLEHPASDHSLHADAPLGVSEPSDDEPTESDVSVERDADAAHYEIARRDEGDAVENEPERTLFDDEAIADLALEPRGPGPSSFSESAASTLWDDDADLSDTLAEAEEPGAYSHAPAAEAPEYEREDGQLPPEPERPRPAVLPIAITLILGLLIGFAAGYAVGGRDRVVPPGTGRAAQGPPPAEAEVPATAPKGTGKAWSEQAVAQPSATPPSIPGDLPPARSPEPPTRVAAATAGRIVVSSTPSRAAVTINGKWRGRTPVTVDALKFGRYTVGVALPGFAVARENVSLSAAEPSRTVSVRLQRPPAAAQPHPPPAARPAPAPRNAPDPRAAFAGSIYVDSRPRGARVFIDGRALGTTPALIPEVSIGSHVVRLELADHRAWTASTRVTAGQQSRVTGSLERIR